MRATDLGPTPRQGRRSAPWSKRGEGRGGIFGTSDRPRYPYFGGGIAACACLRGLLRSSPIISYGRSTFCNIYIYIYYM